jgi:hypothetical protein
MATVFKLDVMEFNKTLDRYLDLSRKERYNELNRRAANICARAANLTPRATADKISDDMKATETIVASYIKTTKRRGEYVALSKGGKTTQGKSTVNYIGGAEALAIANWRLKRGRAMGFYKNFPAKSFAGPGRGKRGGTASQFYSKFIKRARSSAGYIAAGWLPAFNHFSKIAIGKTVKFDKVLSKFFPALTGSAGLGFGIEAIQASGDIVKAIFANAAAGANKIGQLALQDAVKEEEEDMKKYILPREKALADKAIR